MRAEINYTEHFKWFIIGGNCRGGSGRTFKILTLKPHQCHKRQWKVVMSTVKYFQVAPCRHATFGLLWKLFIRGWKFWVCWKKNSTRKEKLSFSRSFVQRTIQARAFKNIVLRRCLLHVKRRMIEPYIAQGRSIRARDMALKTRIRIY